MNTTSFDSIVMHVISFPGIKIGLFSDNQNGTLDNIEEIKTKGKGDENLDSGIG